MNALRNTNSDIVFSGYIHKTEGEEKFALMPPQELKPNGITTIYDIVPTNICTTATILMKKKCLIEDRFDESMPRLQEWELMLRLFPKWKVFFIDEYLVTVNIQTDSIPMNNEAYLEALKKLFWIVGSKYKLENSQLEKQLFEMYSSTSWRITKPLRYIGDLLRKIRNKKQ